MRFLLASLVLLPLLLRERPRVVEGPSERIEHASQGRRPDRKIGKDNGYLVTKKKYSNFQLKVEFWVSSNANSGIFIRCKDGKSISDSKCYEINIYDQRPDPYFGTGAIVKFAGIDPMPKAGGKWNTYEITADGPDLTVVLNGVKTVELKSKKYKSGPIALQYGKGVVKFRKVEIRELWSL